MCHMAYVFLPRDLADGIFATRRAGAGRAGRALSAARTARPGPSRLRRRSPTRTSASRQPRAAQRAQDGHARLAAARVARPVPPSGAGDLLELSAEGSAAAEAGHPRDAGVVQLGLIRERGHRPGPGSTSAAARPRAPSAARPIPPARSGARRPPWLRSSGIESTRQPPDLWREPGGLIWPPRRRHRRRVDRRGTAATSRGRGRAARATAARAENRTSTWRPPLGDTSATYRAPNRSSSWPSSAAWRSTSPRAGSRSSASIRPVAEPGSYTGTVHGWPGGSAGSGRACRAG